MMGTGAKHIDYVFVTTPVKPNSEKNIGREKSGIFVTPACWLSRRPLIHN
jgi:hypothetical protein